MLAASLTALDVDLQDRRAHAAYWGHVQEMIFANG